MNNIGIILQARMSSKRLPGKILKEIAGKPMLEHIFYRISFLKHKVEAVLATSSSPEDDIVEAFCKHRNIHYFRGSNENVLERFYLCSKEYGFLHIVRLTGDNPFVDIEELDNLIDLHLRTRSDFTNSFQSLPVGVGAEIFTFAALEKSYREAKLPHHIEHVDEYLLENPVLFKTSILSVSPDKNRPDIRLTVDTLEDFQLACYVVKKSLGEFIMTQKAIELSESFKKEAVL